MDVNVSGQHRVRDELIYGQGVEMAHFVKVLSTGERYLCVNGSTIWECICGELEAVWDC